MKITKVGSVTEVEKQKLEKIKQEIEAVKNWTQNCKCSSCASEFNININDIARVYSDEEGISLYGCACPVCGREYTFSASVLPTRGSKIYDFKSYYPKYNNSPGYLCLMEILYKNRVEYCDGVENGYPVRKNRGILRKRYYIGKM